MHSWLGPEHIYCLSIYNNVINGERPEIYKEFVSIYKLSQSKYLKLEKLLSLLRTKFSRTRPMLRVNVSQK